VLAEKLSPTSTEISLDRFIRNAGCEHLEEYGNEFLSTGTGTKVVLVSGEECPL
jgi:hypothetical protein